jgi:hypothetical protein
MTPGEARGLGCLVAFVLVVAGAGGLYFAIQQGRSNPSSTPGHGPREDLADGIAREPPTEPVPGATVLTKCRGVSPEIVMDESAVYFADCEQGSDACNRFDVYAVPKGGGAPRVLASTQPSPRSLVAGPDALYYLTSYDQRAPGPTGLMKVAKSGGPPVKLADASEPNYLALDGDTLTWIEGRSNIVELKGAPGATPQTMGTFSGEAVGLAVDSRSYFVAVRNPSGYRTGPGEEPAREYGLLAQPREQGAKARVIAQVDAIGPPALDEEFVYWAAPATSEYRANYCVTRMSKTGGARTTMFCDTTAKLSMPRIDRGRLYLFSDGYRPGTAEELTVVALGQPGEAPSRALRWAGSYPGAFGYALSGDAIAFKVKGEVAVVSR